MLLLLLLVLLLLLLVVLLLSLQLVRRAYWVKPRRKLKMTSAHAHEVKWNKIKSDIAQWNFLTQEWKSALKNRLRLKVQYVIQPPMKWTATLYPKYNWDI